MKRQAFQPGEIRDENDNIIREGAYGKKSAFATADNKGILDYMINNFDALKDEMNDAVVSATASDATLTLIHKDASKSTVTVNNVNHATKASQDDKGQTIDIATLKNTSAYKNQLQRNTAYLVGDIAYSSKLPSWAYLECTTAGTTGASEPNFSSVSTSMAIADMTDGNVHWRVRDTRCRYEVGDIIAKTTTPKSYEYLLPCNGASFDKTKYPLLAKVFTTGKVPDLTDGRFLEGGTSAGTSKNAGLPNITGAIGGGSGAGNGSGNGLFRDSLFVGALTAADNNYGDGFPVFSKTSPWPSGKPMIQAKFDASLANPIYGASNTVQPKSFTVMYYVCYGG